MSDPSNITLNWDTPVDLKLTGTDRQLDLFFQPGLSWVDGGAGGKSTKMIALFFLENDTSKGTAGMDFQRLVQGMLRWVWGAAGNADPGVAATPKYYQDLYDTFQTQSFAYAQLLRFLKQNFDFRIQEPVATLKGTIFPMFPMLILEPAKKPENIPAEYQVMLEDIGNLTAQFAYDHEFETAVSTPDDSAQEFLFEDYGQLLLRTALQEALNIVSDGISRTMDAVIDKLTDDIYNNLAGVASRFLLHGLRLPVATDPVSEKPVFEATGQQFDLDKALDGGKYTVRLSLPAPDSTTPQIKFIGTDGVTETADLIYEIDRTESTKNAKYPFVALIDAWAKLTNPLTFDLENGEAKDIAPMLYYSEQKRIYALRKWIRSNTDDTEASYLLQIPLSLQQFLAGITVNPTITIHYSAQNDQQSDPLKNTIGNTDYNWAVQIDVSIRQVVKKDSGDFLTGVFELVDISESQINVLEAALLHNEKDKAKIQLLSRAPGGNGLAPLPGNLGAFTLLRNNFSTNGSIPASMPPAMVTLPAETAALDDNRGTANQQFLQLLWEGATLEGGGYFFATTMSQSEQEAVFESRDSILLSLLIEYEIDGDPIFDFHNTVVLKNQTDPDFLENNLLLALVENYDIPVPVLPPGFVGFKYNTQAPDTQPEQLNLDTGVELREEPNTGSAVIGAKLADKALVNFFNLNRAGDWAFVRTTDGRTGWLPLSTTKPGALGMPPRVIIHLDVSGAKNQPLAELESLYHLLGFGTQDGTDGFQLSKMPIGPASPPGGATGDWLYEKLIPAHAKVAEAKPGTWPATAPPWDQNPYRGIAADSLFQTGFRWQDIYGNAISETTVPKTFPLRYTDALIGINQWPALNEQYQFLKDDQGRWLEIELLFSPMLYAGITAAADDPLARRLKADLATYQKLYYQLQGPGLSFSVTTSLDDAWSHSVDPNDPAAAQNLSAFVLEIYAYLSALHAFTKGQGNVPEYAGNPFLLKIDLSTLNPKQSFIQGISCWMTMLREQTLVHPDLVGDSRLRDIFENKAVLSPKHELVEFTMPETVTDPSLDPTTQALTLETLAVAIKAFLDDRQQTLNLIATDNTITPEEIVLQYRDMPDTILVVDVEEDVNAISIDNLTLADGQTFGKKRDDLNKAEDALTAQLDPPETGMLISTDTESGQIYVTDPATGIMTTTDPVTGVVTTTFTGQFITNEAGLSESGSRKVTRLAGESFEALAQRIDAEMKATLGPKYPVEFRLYDLALNFKTNTGFLKPGTKLTLEPLNIQVFACNFTEAFPDFHIAVSEERNAGGGQANAEGGRPEFLFAVRLGGTGIRYDIADQSPNFYSIPPVSTRLFSGKAMVYDDPQNTAGAKAEKEVEGLDANVLAHEFLAALEDMLEPEMLVPAKAADAVATGELLAAKVNLAQKITDMVAPILNEDFGVDPDPRLEAAKTAMHQRLLDNLLEGFDIETIVQYEATITTGAALPANADAAALPPRMVGKAKVLRTRVGEDPENRMPAETDDIDYTLTTGYFELDQRDGQSAFTYLFDTKTPDKFGNLEMEMEFQPMEMEFNLAKFPDSNAAFESSNKLHFILPANLNMYKIDQALSDAVTAQFGTEPEFAGTFAPVLSSQVDKAYYALNDFEQAFTASLPMDDNGALEQPYRKYLDALLSGANPNYMGRTEVPIPLRYYPLAPSLILQQADADDSSREVIRDLREWQYTIIYEHPEVAQDSIDCIVRLNVPDSEQTLGSDSTPQPIPEFVRLLLNFKENLPGIKAALEPLKAGTIDDENANKALADFAFLAGQIASNWAIIRSTESEYYVPQAGDLHFEVSEETLTYVEDTREAETREGLVFTQQGLDAANLIQLDATLVEADGVPAAAELLKAGIRKVGDGDYRKDLVPKLELPGFLLARIVEIPDDIDVDAEGFSPEELAEMGIEMQGDSYVIHLSPDEALPDFLADAGMVAPDNPEVTAATGQDPERRTFFYEKDPEDQTFFGDSSIPDRKFSIENLDLLQQQNAWAAIWLSRNKHLAFGKTTNPDFIFLTPAVRFTNRLTPSIVNREPWDIATLPAGGATASDATLEQHLINMIDLFDPGVASPDANHQRYELQIACRYAYAMARGTGLNENLVTTLPILLGLRLTPDQLDTYPGKLSAEISTWFKQHEPVETNASLIFSVEAYSQLDPDVNSSLPLLRVTQLALNLNNITNMPDIRIGNG